MRSLRSNQPKASKGQMKCFQCRQPCLSKEGTWQNWKQMQVFLCKPCNLATQDRPERKTR